MKTSIQFNTLSMNPMFFIILYLLSDKDIILFI